MIVADLNPMQWHVVESMDSYTTSGRHVVDQTISSGSRGYARRNAFQPDQIQVLMKDVGRDSIMGYYIPAKECELLLIVLRVANEQSKPDILWSGYWRTRFDK